MLQRFVSAAFVASVAVAFAAVTTLAVPHSIERLSVVFVAWCFVPFAWGVWASVAPGKWVPNFLAGWGAVLGIVAGCVAAFGLKVPDRLVGHAVNTGTRVLTVILLTALYYVLWHFVRLTYGALVQRSPKAMSAASSSRK